MVCLSCSRPTAVNLADACNKLAAIASAAAEAPNATPQSVVEATVMTAEAYFRHDIATCKVLTVACSPSVP
jgi:methylthioribose-1-phosphate isomerase